MTLEDEVEMRRMILGYEDFVGVLNDSNYDMTKQALPNPYGKVLFSEVAVLKKTVRLPGDDGVRISVNNKHGPPAVHFGGVMPDAMASTGRIAA